MPYVVLNKRWSNWTSLPDMFLAGKPNAICYLLLTNGILDTTYFTELNYICFPNY
jgi:hypothetical protein